MGPMGCPETSVIHCKYSLRNNPEESSSHLPRRGGLESCMVLMVIRILQDWELLCVREDDIDHLFIKTYWMAPFAPGTTVWLWCAPSPAILTLVWVRNRRVCELFINHKCVAVTSVGRAAWPCCESETAAWLWTLRAPVPAMCSFLTTTHRGCV